jgi:hypothetical protein
MSGATETAKFNSTVEAKSERTLIEMPNRTHRMNGAYCDSIKQGMYCFKLQPSCGVAGKEKPRKRTASKRPKFTFYDPNQASQGKRRRISGQESPVTFSHSPRAHSSSDSETDEKISPVFTEAAPNDAVSHSEMKTPSNMIQTIVTVDDAQETSVARTSPITPLTPVPQQLLSPQPGLVAFPHAPQFTFSPTVSMPVYHGAVMFVSPAPLTPTPSSLGAKSPSGPACSPSKSPKHSVTSDKTFKYQDFSAMKSGPAKSVNGSSSGPLKFIDYTAKFHVQPSSQNAKQSQQQQQQHHHHQQQQQQTSPQAHYYDHVMNKSPLRQVLKELFLKHSHIQGLTIDKNCVVILCNRRTCLVNGIPSFNPRLVLQAHSDGSVEFIFEVNSVVAKSGKYPEDHDLLHELIVSLDPSSCYCICNGLSDKVRHRVKDVSLQMRGLRHWGFPFQRVDHQECDLWVKSNETSSICSKCLKLEEGLSKFLK